MICMRMLILSLTQYNKSYSMFVPTFKILGRVAPETPLTKKKVYKQTCTFRVGGGSEGMVVVGVMSFKYSNASDFCTLCLFQQYFSYINTTKR